MKSLSSTLVDLTTQLKWRILEGNGIAIYLIGINDNGSFYGLTEADYIEIDGERMDADLIVNMKRLFEKLHM